MSHLTPASILASIGHNCNSSDMMNYHSHDGMSPFDDSDSDSTSSGSSASSFSTNSLAQDTGGAQITYHYFCNIPTCDYHSARSDPVKRHRDTHFPDYKPYICNHCQSSSARRDSTREHCLKQHKDDSENAFRFDTTVPKPDGWIPYEPKRAPWPPVMI
ncbi:hypothetical protein BG006_006595 [Podila minutissima]|uniref:C2H2-type domain-containing protein n=1 Tax=Podila minutissima TaxID=64525 RepID=A0A9P5VLB3_9FUNG|nr:hypothetical protein BG006_006595 [Podila minutissima]